MITSFLLSAVVVASTELGLAVSVEATAVARWQQDSAQADTAEKEKPKKDFEFDYKDVIQVPIQKRTYYVPIRYFIEYMNIPFTDEFKDDKNTAYASFFNHIKSTCYSVIFY